MTAELYFAFNVDRACMILVLLQSHYTGHSLGFLGFQKPVLGWTS